jgi:hypothetical protein
MEKAAILTSGMQRWFLNHLGQCPSGVNALYSADDTVFLSDQMGYLAVR